MGAKPIGFYKQMSAIKEGVIMRLPSTTLEPRFNKTDFGVHISVL